MDLESLGSLPVASLWWRLGESPWTLTVVCKGTLDLTPGELRLSAHQDGIVTVEQLGTGARHGSLYVPADLVPYKPRPEVTLVGWAYAPGGKPAESVTVRLSVGELDKSVQVVAEEAPGGGLQSFVSAPLGYELAAGGPGTLNPVGIAAAPSGPRPRLLPTTSTAGARSDPPWTGTGPVPSHWPTRRRLLHGMPAPTMPTAGGELLLPGEFDLRFFNSAPPDQQLKELPAGATLLLENLHPSHSVLRTRLPRMSPQVFVVRKDGERFEQAATMDTIWVDTQRLVATVTWRVVLELGPRAEYEKAWVVITEAAKRLTWDKLERLVGTIGAPLGKKPGRLHLGAGTSSGGEPHVAAPGGGGLEPATAALGLDEETEDNPRGSDTLAMSERSPRLGREEDTQTEVTASVLLDRSQIGAPPVASHGIPAWLARSGPASSSAGSGAAAAGSTLGMMASSVIIPSPIPAPPPPPVMPPPPPPTTPPPPPAPVPRATMAGVGPLPVGSPNLAPAGELPSPPPAAPSVSAPLGVRPPQPSWMAAGGIQAEPRKPWEDTSSFPRVVSSLTRPTPLGRRDVVELLWFDAAATRRVRQTWAPIADDLEFAPLDHRHDLPNDDPQKARERHMHFGILTEAPQSEVHDLGSILREAVNERGRFTPPLVVLGGRLQFPFDELEILRATAAALTPLAGDDKKLKESLSNVKDLLESPLLQHSNELIDNFVKHLRGLYDGSKRAVSRDYLDTSVERMLLEQRRYQKRSIFDGSWIRALLGPPNGGESIPTYLPESLDKTLPMMVAFRARLIAEVHVKQDQYESSAHALRVVALGRVLDIERAS